jgi:hypothetical protein
MSFVLNNKHFFGKPFGKKIKKWTNVVIITLTPLFLKIFSCLVFAASQSLFDETENFGASARSQQTLDPERGFEVVPKRGLELVPERKFELVSKRGLERGFELVPNRGLQLDPKRGLERGLELVPKLGAELGPEMKSFQQKRAISLFDHYGLDSPGPFR